MKLSIRGPVHAQVTKQKAKLKLYFTRPDHQPMITLNVHLNIWKKVYMSLQHNINGLVSKF